MLALFLTGLLGLVVSLSRGSPGHVDLTPLAWAEGTADCLTDRFGQMGQLVRPAWVEERGVCEVEVHVPARTTFEGPMPAETFVDPITTERVVLVWTTDTGDEATTWFDLIWRETGPEPVGIQAEAEGHSRYFGSRPMRWLVVEGEVGGHTSPVIFAVGTDCTERAFRVLWGVDCPQASGRRARTVAGCVAASRR